MNKEETDYFRALILKRKREILSFHTLDAIKDNQTRTASNPLYVEDEVSETIEREIAYTLASREKQSLQNLNQALERINKNTYGICQTCGAEINKPRLEAVPYATQCIKCQNSEEKRRRGM